MAKGKVDTKQLEQLKKRFEKLSKLDQAAFYSKTLKEIAARVLSKTKKRTPVGVYPPDTGKHGGTLRRGWTVGDVIHDGANYKIEVINPVEYASYVEYGHRTRGHKGWVPGKFMLTISCQEVEQQAPAIIEKNLEKILREVFGS